MPPNGSRASEATMPLTNTAPASMPRASSRAPCTSPVHSAAPRPNSVALASAMAASVSRTRMTAATGPKVSSQPAAMVGVTWSRTVAG